MAFTSTHTHTRIHTHTHTHTYTQTYIHTHPVQYYKKNVSFIDPTVKIHLITKSLTDRRTGRTLTRSLVKKEKDIGAENESIHREVEVEKRGHERERDR